MIDSIDCLLGMLDKNGIDYVHWKSNTNIEKALSGKDDLDILVDQKKKDQIYKLFKDNKIIRGYTNKDSWQNEIFHYFGMDIKEKKLIHIHLHFLLEVGYDLDKSVNLPIVERYILNKIKYKNIYIASIESEYILLIIRLLLKNALIPFVMMLPTAQYKLYRTAKIDGVVTGNAYKEFIDLNSRVDTKKLKNTLTDVFPFLDENLFYQCENILKNNNSLIQYFRYSKKLKTNLNLYRYHSEFKSFLLSFYRINQGRFNKLINKVISLKKTPANGGRIFAFVGGDGAGKSTNIQKLNNILQKHFYTSVIHIGRPNLYILGSIFLLISKIFKILHLNELRQVFIYLAIAYGRYREFLKALKIKEQGGIVILDRIPIAGITSMDAPRIHTIANNRFKYFSSIEKHMHNMIADVDKLIVLKLNPNIALLRRPEDDPDELLIRSGQIWEKDFSMMDNAYVINTENSFDYVEHEILKIIWISINEK